MGVSFSLLIPPISATPPPCPGIVDLPENCVASVMTYLDPPEICKLSMLNRNFRIAGYADCIWESKLPTNYELIIERLFENFDENLCKRDVFALLCRPILLDDGSKGYNWNFTNFRYGDYENFEENLCKRDAFALLCRSILLDGGSKKVWLDKRTGRVCLSISSKGLAITGVDDRRYWSRIETAESRDTSVFGFGTGYGLLDSHRQSYNL
ncbi:F-box protein PP2-A12-like isoform X3 [Lycium barbarum]|uniref:F-box protein PP2-A12-like isoform X3 n=1 Tax=Lycium barbarum TaxID=112863 RepID=UPI00293F453D|nr:F-box protein PP2-A12-like isoform X3 [Lycium barbarum]